MQHIELQRLARVVGGQQEQTSDYARCLETVTEETRKQHRDTRPNILGWPLPGFTDDNEKARAQATVDNVLKVCGQP